MQSNEVCLCVCAHTYTYEKEYLDLKYLDLSTCSLGNIPYTPESKERKREGFKKVWECGRKRPGTCDQSYRWNKNTYFTQWTWLPDFFIETSLVFHTLCSYCSSYSLPNCPTKCVSKAGSIKIFFADSDAPFLQTVGLTILSDLCGGCWLHPIHTHGILLKLGFIWQ